MAKNPVEEFEKSGKEIAESIVAYAKLMTNAILALRTNTEPLSDLIPHSKQEAFQNVYDEALSVIATHAQALTYKITGEFQHKGASHLMSVFKSFLDFNQFEKNYPKRLQEILNALPTLDPKKNSGLKEFLKTNVQFYDEKVVEAVLEVFRQKHKIIEDNLKLLLKLRSRIEKEIKPFLTEHKQTYNHY